MVVDAAEDVCKVGLWVQPVHFGCFDDCHGASEGFATGVCSGKQPIAAANANGPHTPFGRVIIDSHASILEEQSEGGPAAETIAESFCEITFARYARQLILCPGVEGIHLWLGLLFPDDQALADRQAFDLALDIIELTNAIECFFGDFGFGSSPDVMEIPSEMRPAGGFTELGAAIGPGFI